MRRSSPIPNTSASSTPRCPMRGSAAMSSPRSRSCSCSGRRRRSRSAGRGRRAEPLAESVAAIGDRAIAVAGDVSLEADAERMVAETVAAFGGLDVLVNNAGAIRRNVLLHEVPPERWDDQIATNLRGVYAV